MTGIKPGAFSVSLNERALGGSTIADALEEVLFHTISVTHLVRRVSDTPLFLHVLNYRMSTHNLWFHTAYEAFGSYMFVYFCLSTRLSIRHLFEYTCFLSIAVYTVYLFCKNAWVG